MSQITFLIVTYREHREHAVENRVLAELGTDKNAAAQTDSANQENIWNNQNRAPVCG